MPQLPYARLKDLGKASASANSKMLRMSFTKTLTSGWDSEWDPIAVGTGMVVSQSGGNGLITTGTTANAETILRYRMQLTGDLNVRAKIQLSQRIANQNFFVELVDFLGDGLALTVNSSTSVTVRLPDDLSFSAQNVGQSITIGNVAGVAAAIPGRYAIASVSGQNVTFTVAGWPASGSGTCSLFGWNAYRTLFDGTVATAAKFDSYRNGFGSGDTTLAINTTASASVMALTIETGQAAWSDATANSVAWTPRGYRTEGLPEADIPLVLQVRVLNGSTVPASTTTFTVGFVGIDQFDATVVAIGRQVGPAFGNSVTINGTPLVTISGGSSNEDFSAPASAVVVGGVVRTAVAPTTLVANDTCRMTFSSAAQAIFKPFAVAEIDWQYTGILTTTTAAAMRAAGAASIRNYLTGFSFQNTSATATTILILDGATTIAQFNAPASMVAPVAVSFATPLKGTAATAMNVNCGTAGANVLVNSQGYQSP